MMEEEKLRMKEEQGSDYEDDDEQEEEEPVELDQLKKGSSVSSLKKSPSHLSCVSFENNNKSEVENNQDNQQGVLSPVDNTELRKVSFPFVEYRSVTLSIAGQPQSSRLSLPAETVPDLQLRQPQLQPQAAVGEVLLPGHQGAAALR